jgi:chemotaxis protein MotB
MAKKHKCPEFENHERWLVAFADMMTLLFALFVVLYSIANVEKEKLKKVSGSIQKAFGMEAPPDAPASEPKGNNLNEGIFKKIKGNINRDTIHKKTRKEVMAIIAADATKLEREINERLYGNKEFPEASKKASERVVFVNRDQDGIRITLLARKFFKPSETALEEEAQKALDGIAISLKGLGRILRVEGHTDNLPFSKNNMSNWELSASRAAAVVRYFIDIHKFNSKTIYAAGFADSQPIAANDSPENRALNRRVDIKILYETSSEYELQKSNDDNTTEAAPEN